MGDNIKMARGCNVIQKVGNFMTVVCVEPLHIYLHKIHLKFEVQYSLVI